MSGSRRRHPRATAAAAAAAAEAALSAPVRSTSLEAPKSSSAKGPRGGAAAAMAAKTRAREVSRRRAANARSSSASASRRARALDAGARSERHRPPVLATSSASASSASSGKRDVRGRTSPSASFRGLSSRISAFASLSTCAAWVMRGDGPGGGAEAAARARSRDGSSGFSPAERFAGMPAGGSTRARRAVPDEARRLDASSPRVPTPGGARPVRPEPFRSARASPRDAVRARSGPSIARVHPRAERWTRGGVDATEETRGQLVQTVERRESSQSTTRRFRNHPRFRETPIRFSKKPRRSIAAITRPRLRVNNLGQFLRIRVKTQPRRVKIFAATVRPSRIPRPARDVIG